MQPEVKWLMEYLDARPLLEDMQTAISRGLEWGMQPYSYESKNNRVREHVKGVEVLSQALYETFCHILAMTFIEPERLTYQALIGAVQGHIQCKNPLDRAKCAAELIAIAYQAGLVVITRNDGDMMTVTTEYVLEEEIPGFLRHAPQFHPPEPVTHQPILGNRFKQHDGDVCVEYIDRMNSIPLCLETRITAEYSETSSKEFESDEEFRQWLAFVQQSEAMYAKVIDEHDNRFHLNHDVDTRGRVYCDGYLVTYQGASFKKAIVQFAEKEVVQLDP